MKAFLDHLALHVAESMKANSGEIIVLLPNRRSGLFLQHHLRRHFQGTAWMPEILSITDLLDRWSLLSPVDDARAVIRLYDHYSAVKQNAEPLDDFYHWGEMMLRDFDELDKYLVDPGLLFRNLSDLKALEDPMAGLEQDQLAFIRQFWEGFSAGDESNEKKSFLDLWDLLPVLYNRFSQELRAEGQGYDGMRYRELAERMMTGQFKLPEGRIIVAGFNALNTAEKQILDHLRAHGAHFFWDYHRSFLDNELDEAGRFMRENIRRYPPYADFQSNEESRTDPPRIFELPSDVLQARTLHSILTEKEWTGKEACTDTAVVLCDEDLMVPILLSLPSTGSPVNITMGYALKSTPAASFTELLGSLQRRLRRGGDGHISYYHKDVESLLLHPYLSFIKEESQLILEEIKKSNRVMVDGKLLEKGIMKLIFRQVESATQWMSYFRNVFYTLLETPENKDHGTLPVLHREYILSILSQLNKLESILEERPDLEASVFLRLFRKILEFHRIPFEGEPLSGLQLMGILETRLLDFRHVILLSMNEEIMPASSHRNSYIPYALRLAFGLPSREDMDAIYAYYFTRLLQRAEKVDLLFNSKTEGMRSGEMSRYLHRMVLEQDIQIRRPVLDVTAKENHPLEMVHTPATLLRLRRYTDPDEEAFLSPSAINTYIDCPLKFFLRYMAGIGEAREVEEEIGAAGFGTVVHESIRKLYEELADKNAGVLKKDSLAELLKSDRPLKVLELTFHEQHFKGRRGMRIEGRNLIILRVMLGYLKKIISRDMEVAPVELLSTEHTYVRYFRDIRIGGLIDRVDRLQDKIRVIDYKTGSAFTSFSSTESLFEGDQNQRNSAAMQTLLYCWLLEESFPGNELSPGLYVMKELYKKDFQPLFRLGQPRKQRVLESFSEVREEFIEELTEVINHMFDPEQRFGQTTRENRCRYCDFQNICGRRGD